MNKKDSSILDLLHYHIICGRHSGIPDCCIRYFVTKQIWDNDESESKFIIIDEEDFPDAVGYFTCPECIKVKNYIEVKKCPKDCPLLIHNWGTEWFKKFPKCWNGEG